MSKISNVDDILRAMSSGSYLWKSEEGWVLGFGIRSLAKPYRQVTIRAANTVIGRDGIVKHDVDHGPIYTTA